MLDYQLLLSVFSGIVILLVLILYFRLQAFLALLIASIAVGIIAGMEPLEIIQTIQNGMGNTLGFVATVVGLGAMFGAILEYSGGAEALAKYLLQIFGEKRAPWALMLTGFFVAIPVFFDVAFIILVPVIYMLQRKTKKSLLLYGIPLLAGLAATHAFVPPTPGPVAVADILKADLGWVILFGFIAGLPAAILSGPVFGNFIGKKIFIEAPAVEELKTESENYPWIGLIIGIIGIPIFLIVFNTFLTSPILPANFISPNVKKWVQMIGHPFSALILANLIAWYFLGIKRGTGKETLFKITGKSLAPAGIIILLTGAGGVFKEMLIKTGSGDMLANYFSSLGFSIFFFAYLSAALVRMLQGSATVAMITAAGVTAPLMSTAISEMDKALLVIAIASGASILSHVNDSGFWLVSKYLGLNEKQTFKSWTVMTTILSLTGFFCVLILSAIL